jgi:glycosyltransferase involved in cell wall biosynthesis
MISIIVPVYKVEPYLRKCIDSILNQTFTDFECILINDGSPDNCPAICDEYAEKDSRIVVIHQKNSGVSAARNAGLDIARGEWIGFVDSDDWCDPGMFNFLLENAKKNKADISICGYREIKDNKIIKKSKKRFDTLINSRNAIIKLFSNGYYDGYSWNKLVNKRLFDKNDNLRFNSKIKYSEDRLLFYYLFKYANIIYYSSNIYYNYCWRRNSVTVKRKKIGITQESITRFKVFNEILENENDYDIRKRVMAQEGIYAASSCFFYIKQNGFIYDDNYLFLKNIVIKNIKSILIHGTIKQKMFICLLISLFIFMIFYKKVSKKY